MTSNELKKYTEDELNKAGWHVFRVNAGFGGRYNTKQAPDFTPDVIGYDPAGRYIGLEIKVGKDVLSAGQKKELQNIALTAHGRADIVRHSTDVDDILATWPAWYPDAEVITFDEGTEVQE